LKFSLIDALTFDEGGGVQQRAALSGFRPVAVGHPNDFFKTPNVVAQANCQCGVILSVLWILAKL
jgi:hypothetical protein